MLTENKKTIIVSALILILLIIGANFISKEIYSLRYFNPIKKVKVKDAVVTAEIVSGVKKIEEGLSGRKDLKEGRGMLFVMPADRLAQFWMRGMQFPLDIIWIRDGKVLGCEKNILPDDDRIFSSPGFSSHVLEVNKGFCDSFGIVFGDDVVI